MGKLSRIATIFNRDSLIENGSNITHEKGAKNLNKGAKIAGAVLGAGLMMASLTGCPQPNGPEINIPPREPETPRIIVAEPTTTPETEPTNGAEATNGDEATNDDEATIGDGGTSNKEGNEEVTTSDPVEPDSTFDPSLLTPQSHTPIGDSPYELHCFGDSLGLTHETVNEVDAYRLDEARNYFKDKAQQIEANTADRPAIRAYFQDLIDTLNNVDQYNTFGDINRAVNIMAGRYMGDVMRGLNLYCSNRGIWGGEVSCYFALKYAYEILANENEKSGFGADFVGFGDYDYRINREEFERELAVTKPDRNSFFRCLNVNIADEYTNGFQGTRAVLDTVTNYSLGAMNGEQRFNNQLTLADEQMVYNVALATRALKSTARMFNSGMDRATATESGYLYSAYHESCQEFYQNLTK